MLKIMDNVPANVVGFIATGEVTKQDYETVLIPAVDKAAKEFGELHFLLVLDTDVKNFTLGAWWNDAKVGLKHLTKWKKMAIVSDQKGVEKMTDLLSYVMPGESKGFTHAELQEAVKWVSL